MNKKIFIILAIIIPIVSTSLLIIGVKSSKITTFEECEEASWLVRYIKIYDSVGGYGSIEKECVLWGGKRFVKNN